MFFKLANLPDKLINRASSILKVYEAKEEKRDIKIQESLPLDELCEKTQSLVEERIKEIDPLRITPIDALNLLCELKELANKS